MATGKRGYFELWGFLLDLRWYYFACCWCAGPTLHAVLLAMCLCCSWGLLLPFSAEQLHATPEFWALCKSMTVKVHSPMFVAGDVSTWVLLANTNRPPPGGGWTAQVECRPFQIGDGGIFWSSFCLFFHLHALSAAQWLFSTSFPFWARWALLVSRRQHLSISPMRHPLKLHWASSQLSWPPGLLLPSSPDANAACGPHCTPWGIKSGHLQWIGGADATRLEGGQNDSAFQMWVSLYPRSSLVEYLVLNFYNLKSMHKTQKSFKKEEYGQ